MLPPFTLKPQNEKQEKKRLSKEKDQSKTIIKYDQTTNNFATLPISVQPEKQDNTSGEFKECIKSRNGEALF